MKNRISASNYKNRSIFKNNVLTDILIKIYYCFEDMKNKKSILENNENSIRDHLLKNYLHNNNYRHKHGLLFHFNREVPEDDTIGRVDIKIETPDTLEDTKAYYIIECKRLDNINQKGKTGLNAKYIEEGMHRFIYEKYSSLMNTNAMLGFIVDKLDINHNCACINTVMKTHFPEINILKELTNCSDKYNIDYFYYSEHKKEKSGSDLKIYHLMIDLSDLVN